MKIYIEIPLKKRYTMECCSTFLGNLLPEVPTLKLVAGKKKDEGQKGTLKSIRQLLQLKKQNEFIVCQVEHTLVSIGVPFLSHCFLP